MLTSAIHLHVGVCSCKAMVCSCKAMVAQCVAVGELFSKRKIFSCITHLTQCGSTKPFSTPPPPFEASGFVVTLKKTTSFPEDRQDS